MRDFQNWKEASFRRPITIRSKIIPPHRTKSLRTPIIPTSILLRTISIPISSNPIELRTLIKNKYRNNRSNKCRLSLPDIDNKCTLSLPDIENLFFNFSST